MGERSGGLAGTGLGPGLIDHRCKRSPVAPKRWVAGSPIPALRAVSVNAPVSVLDGAFAGRAQSGVPSALVKPRPLYGSPVMWTSP